MDELLAMKAQYKALLERVVLLEEQGDTNTDEYEQLSDDLHSLGVEIMESSVERS